VDEECRWKAAPFFLQSVKFTLGSIAYQLRKRLAEVLMKAGASVGIE
jgi:hypothetical protein